MTEQAPVRKRRHWLRFSLASLLVAMSCLAGFLTGYRNGHRQGREVWNLLPAYQTLYNVQDLAHYRSAEGDIVFDNVDDVAQHVRSTIAPGTWEESGGEYAVAVFAEKDALVISTNQYVHELIATLLESLRQDSVRLASAGR